MSLAKTTRSRLIHTHTHTYYFYKWERSIKNAKGKNSTSIYNISNKIKILTNKLNQKVEVLYKEN